MSDRNQWSNDAAQTRVVTEEAERQRLERAAARRTAAYFAKDADDLRVLLNVLGLNETEPVGRVVMRCSVTTCNRTMLGIGGDDDASPGGRGMCNRCYRLALHAVRADQEGDE